MTAKHAPDDIPEDAKPELERMMRLHWAAPELLKALEPLLQYAIDVDDSGLTKGFRAEKNKWIRDALVVINKVEGKS